MGAVQPRPPCRERVQTNFIAAKFLLLPISGSERDKFHSSPSLVFLLLLLLLLLLRLTSHPPPQLLQLKTSPPTHTRQSPHLKHQQCHTSARTPTFKPPATTC